MSASSAASPTRRPGSARARPSATCVDQLVDAGATVFFGETSELTGGEHLVAERGCDDEVARARSCATYDDYSRRDRRRRRRRPARVAADQGQHRGRALDDRGEGAREHPEARHAAEVHRRARPGRGADEGRGSTSWTPRPPPPRRHAVGRGRRRGPPLPDGPGQRHRQPDRAGDQDHRQPADRRDDERAHRPRCLRPADRRPAVSRRATSCSKLLGRRPTAG